jgi:D-alanyl-D-alanine carboxypeptidase
LIGRYPGADGMKTGFICASGFNLVASATRNGRRLIAVVLGAPSSPMRAAKAAQLLETGFNGNSLAWLTPTLGTVDQLQPIAAAPPNLRDDTCGPKRKRPGVEDSDDDNVAINLAPVQNTGSGQSFSLFSTAAASPSGTMKPSEMLAMAPAPAEPLVVYTGPKKDGAALVAAVAADEASQQVKGKGKRGRGTRVAAVKPAAKLEKKPDAETTAAAKPAAPKTVAKPAPDKSATASIKPADKPKTAAPKTTPKPDAKSSAVATGTKLAAKRTDKPKDAPKSQ